MVDEVGEILQQRNWGSITVALEARLRGGLLRGGQVAGEGAGFAAARRVAEEATQEMIGLDRLDLRAQDARRRAGGGAEDEDEAVAAALGALRSQRKGLFARLEAAAALAGEP